MPDSAAAAAYYSLLSLFPLLLLIIVIGSFFLDIEKTQQKVLNAVLTFVPSASQDLITLNISQVLDHRRSVGILGLIGLLWGASGAFFTIQDNLSRAWPQKPVRSLWRAQLFAVFMVAGAFLLLIAFSLGQAILGLLFGFIERFPGVLLIYELLSRMALYVFITLSFAVVYKLVPKAEVQWYEAVSGALFSSTLTQIFSGVFGWFLSSKLNQYNLIYGSLGALVAFIFWLFIMNLVILAGGHLSAAVAKEWRGVETE